MATVGTLADEVRQSIATQYPANIYHKRITKDALRGTRPVTSLDIAVGGGSDLHPDGLYSVEIFGQIGTPARFSLRSYIDLKTTIIAPKLYKDLTRLKGLYEGIISGKTRAIYDASIKDFVASDDPTADTGYSFFFEHFHKVKLNPGKSPQRQDRVALIEAEREHMMTQYAVVLAAGYRDIELDATGRWVKDEINDLYYRLLSLANTVSVSDDPNAKHLDRTRYQMTLTYLAIYEDIANRISGKEGILLQKFGSRKIDFGTANVVVSTDNTRSYLVDSLAPSQNHTVLGLFQVVKSLGPIALKFIYDTMIASRIDSGDGMALLVDPKTLKRTQVDLSIESRDRYGSIEGLKRVVNSYYEKTNRLKPIVIDGYYLCLVYQDDKHFKVFDSIDELPDGFDKRHVRPINLCEFIYLSGYNRWNDHVGICTRYPWTGPESTFPSLIYVRTTERSLRLRELDEQWQPIEGDKGVATVYPLHDETQFVDAQSPAVSRAEGMGMDYDGDRCTWTSNITEEAISESKAFLGSRNAWLNPDGSMRASAATDTVKFMFRAMTRRRTE
jgi:hypothetical protein